MTYTFGDALVALKQGRRIARRGWNGVGMWIMLLKTSAPGPIGEAGKYRTRALDGGRYYTDDGCVFDVQDCIGMKTSVGTIQPGWVASQADLLAEDWEILP